MAKNWVIVADSASAKIFSVAGPTATKLKEVKTLSGRCGGIKHQIQDGVNGLLVSSVDEAAAAIIRILKDPTLGEKLGKAARETVFNEPGAGTKGGSCQRLRGGFTANQQRLAQLSLAAVYEPPDPSN